MADELPPAAALMMHTVGDFDTWKAGFDAHESGRRAGGIVGHHINRGEDDPNQISIYLAVADVDKAKAMASSPELAGKMKEAGVISEPRTTWMKPLREAVAWEGEHPAMVITHSVADVDQWLQGYDAADDLRRANGIIGHAANQSTDDPSTMVVYHQADSFDALRTFLDLTELRQAMEEAGVTSPPEVSFHTGGWGKRYE